MAALHDYRTMNKNNNVPAELKMMQELNPNAVDGVDALLEYVQRAGGNVVFIGNISRFDGLENRDESVYKADDDDDNHDLQDDDDNNDINDASGSQNFQPSMVPPNVNAGTSISQTISKLFKLKAWNHTMQISTQMNKV